MLIVEKRKASATFGSEKLECWPINSYSLSTCIDGKRTSSVNVFIKGSGICRKLCQFRRETSTNSKQTKLSNHNYAHSPLKTAAREDLSIIIFFKSLKTPHKQLVSEESNTFVHMLISIHEELM